MISFVIPTYNVGRTIDRLLKSIADVMSNIREEWEVIIIDNYSVDDTLIKLRRWKQKAKSRLRIYQLKSSRGRARDFGVKVARGEVIIPLDGDMVLIKEAFLSLLHLYRLLGRNYIILTFTPPIGVLGVIPRKYLAYISWRNLNYDENVDFQARLFRVYEERILVLPLRCAFHLEVRPPALRERYRYVRGLKGLLRIVINRISLSIGLGDTMKSRYLKFKYLYRKPLFATITSMLLNKILQLIGVLMMLKFSNENPLLDNLRYVYIRKIIASLRLLRILINQGVVMSRSLRDYIYIPIRDIHYLYLYCPSIMKVFESMRNALDYLFRA